MNVIEQFIEMLRQMPMSKKVSMVLVLGLVGAGFALMFLWANQIDYQLLYSNLSQDDAAAMVSKLRDQRIPYRLEGGGSVVMVPADKVYETRLALAGEGLPRGGNVGFEIFDQTNFSTTEFVQKLNYQRALQGELSRTISQFQEVEQARVLVVLPKESLFVEDAGHPSASVLLKLRSRLSQDKVAGIVHIVASAVEGLTPESVTVVDTTGKVLFKGPGRGDEAALISSNRLDYQREFEGKIGTRIQSMLEGIVGQGKAIVRVSAEIDFDQIDLSEEKYDPENSAVRSKQRRVESSEKGGENPVAVPSTIPGQPGSGSQGSEGQARVEKEDEVVNYEINRVTRRVVKPSGAAKRLSVAAVVDGTYEAVTAEDGSKATKFIARGQKELEDLENIVKKAMGYNADREDQVQVSCFPLSVSGMKEKAAETEPATDWVSYGRQYVRPVINLMLVVVVFFLVVRPLLKSMRNVTISTEGRISLPGGTPGMESAALPEPGAQNVRDKSMMLAKRSPDRTQQVLRGWLEERE